MLPRRLALMIALGLVACGGTTSLRWEYAFEDPSLEPTAAVLVAEILEGGCDVSAVSVYTAEIPIAGAAEVMQPPSLAPGFYGFRLTARDSACDTIATGCVGLEVEPGTSRVAVQLSSTPPAPACDAASCNGGLCGSVGSFCPAECTAGCVDGDCTITDPTTDVRCPDGRACRVRCEAAGSCPERIHCPEDGSPCVVECLGDDSCARATDCEGASTCDVTCTGARSCAGNNNCKDSGTCTITCDGPDSCSGRTQCRTSTCTVVCSEANSCAEEVECEAGGSCDVTCAGPNSCALGTICDMACPCAVSCTGAMACATPAICTAGCEDGSGCTSAGVCSTCP